MVEAGNCKKLVSNNQVVLSESWKYQRPPQFPLLAENKLKSPLRASGVPHPDCPTRFFVKSKLMLLLLNLRLEKLNVPLPLVPLTVTLIGFPLFIQLGIRVIPIIGRLMVLRLRSITEVALPGPPLTGCPSPEDSCQVKTNGAARADWVASAVESVVKTTKVARRNFTLDKTKFRHL